MEDAKTLLWSPNSLVRDYFQCLLRTYQRSTESQDEEIIRQEILLTIIMAVTVVETFINLYFDIVIHEKNIDKKLLKNPRGSVTLDYKIRKWPKSIFNRNLELQSGAGKDFMELKELRNNLVHYRARRTSHDTGFIKITGFDFEKYYSLDTDTGNKAIQTIINFIAELFKLNDIKEKDLKGIVNLWTGCKFK